MVGLLINSALVCCILPVYIRETIIGSPAKWIENTFECQCYNLGPWSLGQITMQTVYQGFDFVLFSLFLSFPFGAGVWGGIHGLVQTRKVSYI